MPPLEISKSDITSLNDADLRELIGLLCEAELKAQSLPVSGALWGGSQTTADSGLDVEIALEVNQSNPDFIPRSHTGFQVKKNSMSRKDCANEMHHKDKLRPIIKQLISEKGAYIIISGKDNCSKTMLDQRIEEMTVVVSNQKHFKNLKLDFYGVDRIATWVRKHPSIALWIRKTIGKPLSGWKGFERWAATPSAIKDKYLIDEKLLVLDSTISSDCKSSIIDSINKIRLLLLTSKTAVRITGLSGVGKTRFAQALFERDIGKESLNPSEVIYADLGENIEPSATDMLSQLIAQNERMILVLDNCPPDVHRSLQKKLKEAKSQLSLLTIEYDISDDKPEETKVFHLEPASEEIVNKILNIRFPDLGQLNSRIISGFSGGNSRLAIALAERVEAGESLSGFSDEELFQRLFSQRKGNDNDLLECAEALSLVYSFNIDTTVANSELDALAKISGKTRNELYRASSSLLKRQLIQKRADWRALLPHALANRIAKQALSNIPVNQILSIILIPENKRLLKSFSKRLSYLHDSEEARTIVQEWLSEKGIFSNLNNFNTHEIDILNNIASVNPSATLKLLKVKAEKKEFITRKNTHFSRLVVLLRKLAYEECLFNDVVDLLVKFAMAEKANNNYDNANKVVSALFRITLSGTQASPEVREKYLRGLFTRGNEAEKRIAVELLNTSLRTSHFVSNHNFEFGARPRSHGYHPPTNSEQKNWYLLFLSLSLEMILSDSSSIESKQKIKIILGNNFRGLWRIGMHDELENIANEITKTGYWFDGWKGALDTIQYEKNIPSSLKNKLNKIEKALKPIDVMSKIDALVFHELYENIRIDVNSCEDNEKEIQKEITDLGQFVANDTNLFKEISARLFIEATDAQRYFGQGLAKGSKNKIRFFKDLLRTISTVPIEQLDNRLLGGYIQQIHSEKPDLANELLDLVLLNTKTRKFFVSVQCYVPICNEGYKRILSLTDDKTTSIWQFQSLAYGRSHESLTDDELAKIIEKININTSNFSVPLKILQMRFHRINELPYSDNLLHAGRSILQNIFTSYEEDPFNDIQDYTLNKICEICLTDKSQIKQINNVLRSFMSALIEGRIYAHSLPDTIKTVCEKYTYEVLDILYDVKKNRDHVIYRIFRDNLGRGYPFDLVNSDEIIRWCKKGKLERYNFAATTIFPFISTAKDKSNNLELNRTALDILDATPNKEEVVKTYYLRCSPSMYSGSITTVMQSRRKALEILHEHTDKNVSDLSKKLSLDVIKEEIESKQNEKERDSQIEQRFE